MQIRRVASPSKLSPVRLLLLLALAIVVDVANALHLRHGNSWESNSNVFQQQQQQRQHLSAEPFDAFPHLADVAEMANLSHAVYKYKHIKVTNNNVCEHWNNQTKSSTTHEKGVTCHWYHHDEKLGTQVMIASSTAKDYLAVVFAGTDDLKTSLLDVDVRKIAFGTEYLEEEDNNNRSANNNDIVNTTKIPVSINCSECKVHAGFNNAVFENNIFDEIYIRVEKLRPKFSRLFTTGHSLGAANSILTAVGLAVEFEQKDIALDHPVTSLNFGCPQVGNVEFRDFINKHFLTHPNTTTAHHSSPYLVIWRYVLGWDLVPRLPEFFEHIGHTVQMHHPECHSYSCDYDKWVHPHHDNTTGEALAYYHHIGNETLEYAGVPTGWSAKPYVWVPGALLSHAISKYADFVNQWYATSPKTWVHDFVAADDDGPSSNSSDALIDDDTYAEPPDDDATQLLLAQDMINEREDESPDSLWQGVQRKLMITTES